MYKQIVESMKDKKVLIIGDIILDHYIYGNVTRISPEAPVPIVNKTGESYTLGGAANVANNIAKLGAIPILIGTLGHDANQHIVKGEMYSQSISTDYLIIRYDRPTTTKTRVVGNRHHVCRIDDESVDALEYRDTFNQMVIRMIKPFANTSDVVIFSDYDKGVIGKDLITMVNDVVECPIIADPKERNFWHYRNIDVFKPNQKEAEKALGRKIRDISDASKSAYDLVNRLNLTSSVITLGDKGMVVAYKENIESDIKTEHIKARKVDVYDVTGAGDTATAVISLAIASGASYREATELANIAAGIVVTKPGCVPITKPELLNYC